MEYTIPVMFCAVQVWVSYLPFFLYTDYRVTLPYINRLYPELDSYNPNLIHVVSPTLHGIYGLRYARRRGIHAVTCYHTNFIDYLSSTELSVWYASSDLFVFPSTTETFGNVILEAFASGLPAVVVNKGGCADLVTPRVNGYIAKPHDSLDFATKISFFLNSKSSIDHFSLAAIETAQNYNWNVINKNLIDSYRKLVFCQN